MLRYLKLHWQKSSQVHDVEIQSKDGDKLVTSDSQLRLAADIIYSLIHLGCGVMLVYELKRI